MTPRPSIAGQSKQRPLSAIYIGPSTSTSTPPDLPRLPEPPSPGGSSNGSETGLPSPPATNSTGSVGDDTGTAHTSGSLRKRTSAAFTHRASYSVPSVSSLVAMYDGQNSFSRRNSKTFKNSNNDHSTSALSLSDDDNQTHEDGDELDEDTTARFDSLSRRQSHRTPAKGDEHNSALQRVKSLTERNRMVLNKLSSIQRLSSPAPPKPTRSPYSPPNDSPTPHSRVSSCRASTSLLRDGPVSFTPSHLHMRNGDRTHSGSETERESQRSRSSYVHHQHSSSDSMSATPTSAIPEATNNLFTSSSTKATRDRSLSKYRRMSAPGSPGQDALKLKQRERPPRDASPEPTPGPSQARTPRKRLSHSTAYVEREEERRRNGNREDETEGAGRDDIMSAALAAVALSRAESVGVSASRGKRVSRNPLPSAFRDEEGGEGTSHVPATPHRHHSQSRQSTPSPSTRPSTSNGVAEQRSPRRRENTRISISRDPVRRHQARWASDDFTSSHADAENEPTTPSRSRTSTSNYAGIGRRQTPRHGSAEVLLSPSKRYADEGFHVAGTRRREGEDSLVNGHTDTRTPLAQTRRTHSTGARSMIFGEDEWESPVATKLTSTLGGPPRPSDPRTPGNILQRLSDRPLSYLTPASRPGTSMAALHHERVPQTAPPASRPYRVTHEREASTSAATLDDSLPGSGRMSTVPGTSAANHAEHRRLMLDALGMFESQLSRLPPMGQTTTTTIPEVFHNSQQFVHSLDKLNALIRASVSEALEGQIEADIADPGELQATMSELWTKIGCEEREKMRLSDEIVRTTTQFLLGIGKVLRDSSASASASSHLRTMSLDDDATRRLATADASTSSDRRSSNGRQSRETRSCWDPRDGGVLLNDRLAELARNHTAGSSRPTSAMHSLTRGSSGGSNESRSTKDGVVEQTPSATSRLSAALTSNPSTRRLYTPREPRVTSEVNTRAPLMSSIDSQDTVHAYEPSPTPSSRQGSSRTHSRILSSLPPSLPTLLSESLLSGKDRASASPENHPHSGRKISTSSNMTVRAEGSSFSAVIKPPSATTAVSTSDSPPSMSRTSSRSSVAANGVTFSRPSTVSISALSGLQQQTNGLSRTSSTDSSTHTPSPAVRELMSGSETERPRTSTLGARGRASLDSARANLAGTSSQASTLNSIRRERRRTITEIFAQVK
ncbi:hypothetical protein BDY19DRAFT_994650 [Irpex rosettiformis]|uniref:Uncharacterized protein n=1 Tax=Irpex rosettiformis TaxID=378272 RepID=A0ACB8U0J3_9APHY|nr:hypothetical protein BDY19DRAFT_994650 [Irpex rosettiformis]